MRLGNCLENSVVVALKSFVDVSPHLGSVVILERVQEPLLGEGCVAVGGDADDVFVEHVAICIRLSGANEIGVR